MGFAYIRLLPGMRFLATLFFEGLLLGAHANVRGADLTDRSPRPHAMRRPLLVGSRKSEATLEHAASPTRQDLALCTSPKQMDSVPPVSDVATPVVYRFYRNTPRNSSRVVVNMPER